MRKINPLAVKADFDARTLEVHDFHVRVDGFVKTMADRSILSEATLLRLAVLWEGFLSDLFVAYINGNSAEFANHLNRSVEAELQGKAARIYEQFATLDIPKHLQKGCIFEILDADGFNVTFSTASEIKKKAEIWLAQADRNRISSIDKRAEAAINLLYALRNHLAHGSQGSLDRMNDSLLAPGLYNTGLQRVIGA